jgi:cobyrinic acid a,c-diamide synthase
LVVEDDMISAKLPPRLVIGAPQGRSGKTSVTMGLCVALRDRGLIVQTFKKGPDYIDPSWLAAASGRPCRNLDGFFMSPQAMVDTFRTASDNADMAVIEGAMGLFDGYSFSGEGNTAHLASLLRAPVVLVVNSSRMTYSVAPMVMGFQQFDPNVRIAGVILNNVAGPRHERKLKEALEGHCDIPVLGAVPRDPQTRIADRHLGLVPFGEDVEGIALLGRLRDRIVPYLDVERIVAIAEGAGESHASVDRKAAGHYGKKVKIGLFRDRVFSFYYPENLEALEAEGAELVRIDSLRDSALPKIDGLYIGGGFPELFAPQLEANKELRDDVARAIEEGLPVYAECAGLMYLCRRIHWQGEWYKMTGIIPADVEMCAKPQGHGYVEVEAQPGNPYFQPGSILKGHEFHHSRLLWSEEPIFGYRMKRGHGVNGEYDGIVYKNLFAAYTHLHVAAVPEWTGRFMDLVVRKKNRSSPIKGAQGDESVRRSYGGLPDV